MALPVKRAPIKSKKLKYVVIAACGVTAMVVCSNWLEQPLQWGQSNYAHFQGNRLLQHLIKPLGQKAATKIRQIRNILPCLWQPQLHNHQGGPWQSTASSAMATRVESGWLLLQRTTVASSNAASSRTVTKAGKFWNLLPRMRWLQRLNCLADRSNQQHQPLQQWQSNSADLCCNWLLWRWAASPGQKIPLKLMYHYETTNSQKDSNRWKRR